MKYVEKKGGLASLDADGDGVLDEVEEVRDELFRHHHVLYGCFDYYATYYSEEGVKEVDTWNLTFNAYLAFCSHCKVVSST